MCEHTRIIRTGTHIPLAGTPCPPCLHHESSLRCCLRNDGRAGTIENNHIKDYERLVRRVLSLPNRPPMIMMQVSTGQSSMKNLQLPFYEGIHQCYFPFPSQQTFSHGMAFPLGDKDRTPFSDGLGEAMHAYVCSPHYLASKLV